MRPFDFVIAFLAFIYALTLTHLLLAIAHMIRHRRQVRLDFVHTVWMLNALLLLFANWISLWDFHKLEQLSLATILSGLFYGVNQYLVCALVAPRLDGEDGFDMHAFQESQGRTYIAAFAVLVLVSIPLNFLAGSDVNVQNWTRENAVVFGMLAVVLPPLFFRARWVQVAAPIAFLFLVGTYLVEFYPVLR